MNSSMGRCPVELPAKPRRRLRILALAVCGLLGGKLHAQICDIPGGEVELDAQSAVETFQADYGPCVRIDGHLYIRGPDISDLSPLSALEEVRGNLELNHTTLTTLQGFTHLGLVYGLYLNDNDELLNLAGLEALQSVYTILDVSGHAKLESLDGLSAVTLIGSYLMLQNNAMLNDLQALGNAELYYQGQLEIRNNSSLTSLYGLPIARELVHLEIEGNPLLLSLAGLSVVDGSGMRRLSVQSNPLITDLDELAWVRSVESLTLYNNRRLSNIDALANLERAASYLSVMDNACLSNCTGLQKLLDQNDDGEPGPGPGLDGIPDVGWMITMSGNLRGCNSPGELFEVIFFDSLECE